MAGWSLFVDETGGFAPGDPSFVVGLLAEADAASLDRGVLRRELADIWGPGPSPPHATIVRRVPAPVLHGARAAGGRAGMRPGRFASALRGPCAALEDVLARGRMAARLEQIRAGARPTWEDVELADALLRGVPDYPAAAAVVDQQVAAMNDLVARVFRRLGTATVVAVRSDEDPPGPPPPPREVRRDAYVRALELLLERLARLAGEPEVEAWVLARDVEVGGLGAPVSMQGFFLRQLVEQANVRAGGRARLRAGGATLRFRDVPGEGADPLHPMLVLADWVANGLRAAAGRRHVGLDPLVRTLVDTRVIPAAEALSRVPAHAPRVGPLPTLAAAGAPEDEVRAAFRHEPPPPRPSGFPPWAWDQADLWVASVGRWP